VTQPPDPEPGDDRTSDPAPATGSTEPATTGRRRRRRRRQGYLERHLGRTGANLVEWAIVIVGAVVLALVVKTFLLQAFYIPSASMEPTLREGDRVLVNKLSYDLHDVHRGDVVVFERPPEETASDIPDLIKRVIGLPGEQIVIEAGHVYVDGQMLEEDYLPAGTDTSTDISPLKCSRDDPCQVPDGDVWVMGDNRNDSRDSRWFGPIDESTIVGRAFVVVWPLGRLGTL
jgi:signal peptidase I